MQLYIFITSALKVHFFAPKIKLQKYLEVMKNGHDKWIDGPIDSKSNPTSSRYGNLKTIMLTFAYDKLNVKLINFTMHTNCLTLYILQIIDTFPWMNVFFCKLKRFQYQEEQKTDYFSTFSTIGGNCPSDKHVQCHNLLYNNINLYYKFFLIKNIIEVLK